MPHRITISAGPVELSAELHDSPTAQAIWSALPLSIAGNTWGDEIYFRIPVDAEGRDLNEVVELGDLAFWPPGNALCIFYGPTPASRGDEIRAASGVEVVGRITGDAALLRQAPPGSVVTLAPASTATASARE